MILLFEKVISPIQFCNKRLKRNKYCDVTQYKLIYLLNCMASIIASVDYNKVLKDINLPCPVFKREAPCYEINLCFYC